MAITQTRDIKIVVQTKNAQQAAQDIVKVKEQLILMNKAMNYGSHDAATIKQHDRLKQSYDSLLQHMLKIYKVSKDGKNFEVLQGKGKSIPKMVEDTYKLQQGLSKLSETHAFKEKTVASLSKVSEMLGKISRTKIDPGNKAAVNGIATQFNNLATAVRNGTIAEKEFKTGFDALKADFNDLAGITKYSTEVRKQVQDLIKLKATLRETSTELKGGSAYKKALKTLKDYQKQIRVTGEVIDKSSYKYVKMAENVKLVSQANKELSRTNKALTAEYSRSNTSVDSAIRKLDEYKFTLERAIASKKKWTYTRNIKEAQKYVESLNKLDRRMKNIKKALEQTNPITQQKRFTKLNAALAKTTRAYDKVHSSANKVKAAMSDMSPFKWAGEVAKRAATYAGIYANLFAMVAMLRKGVGAVLEFDKAVHQMSAVFDISAERSSRLEDKLIGLGMAFGGSMKEINSAALALGRAGIAADKVAVSTAIVIKMAKLTGDTISESADAIITYQTVFGQMGYSSEQLGDQLAYVANQSRLSTKDISTYSNYLLSSARAAGISLEAVNALTISFSNAGVNASTIGTQLRTFNNTLTKNSSAVKNFYNSIGISQGRFTAQLKMGTKSSNEAMDELMEKLGTLSDIDFEKATAGMAIRSRNALSIMRNIREEYKKHREALSGGVDGELNKANYITESYIATWEKVKNSVSAAFYEMTESLMPMIKTFGDSIASVFKNIATHSDQFATAFKKAAAVIAIAGVALNSLAMGSFVTTIGSAIIGVRSFAGVWVLLKNAMLAARTAMIAFTAHPIIAFLALLAGAVVYAVSTIRDETEATDEYNKAATTQSKITELVTKQKIEQAEGSFAAAAATQAEVMALQDIEREQKKAVKLIQDKKREQALTLQIQAASTQASRAENDASRSYWEEKEKGYQKERDALTKSNRLIELKNKLEDKTRHMNQLQASAERMGKEWKGYKNLTAAATKYATEVAKLGAEIKKLSEGPKGVEDRLQIVPESSVKHFAEIASTLKSLKKDGRDVEKSMLSVMGRIQDKINITTSDLSKSIGIELEKFGKELPAAGKKILDSLHLKGDSSSIRDDVLKTVNTIMALEDAQRTASKEEAANYELVLGVLRRNRNELENVTKAKQILIDLDTARQKKIEINTLRDEELAHAKTVKILRERAILEDKLNFYREKGRDYNPLEALAAKAKLTAKHIKDARVELDRLLEKRKGDQAKFDKPNTSEVDQQKYKKRVEKTTKDILSKQLELTKLLNTTKGYGYEVEKATTEQMREQANIMNSLAQNTGNYYGTIIKEREDFLRNLDSKGYNQDAKDVAMDAWDKDKAKDSRRDFISSQGYTDANPYLQNTMDTEDNQIAIEKYYTEQQALAEVKAATLATELEKMSDSNLAKLALEQEYTDAKNEITLLGEQKESAIKQEYVNKTLADTQSGLGQALTLAETFYTLSGKRSKAAFKVMQGIQVAQAIITTYATAVKAYQSGFVTGTPADMVIGAANMAVAIANGMAQVAAIKAQKYHTGGFVGEGNTNLTSDEVPAILQKGEYVLSRNDISELGQAKDGDMGGTPGGETVIINSLDPTIIEQWATSRKGRKVIRNIINGDD